MSYTNDWDETTPADHTKFKVQPEHVRDVKIDLGERLAAFFYGFTSGETKTGLKYLKGIVQTTAPSTATDVISLYPFDSDSVVEWFIKDESANVIQLTKKGYINLSNAALDNDDFLIAIDSTGTGTVDIIKVNASNETIMGRVVELGDASRMASAAAPTADAEISNKKYVDDQVGAVDTTPEAARVKGWGTVSWSGGVPTLDANLNVSGITDIAVGKINIQWDTDFATANYVFLPVAEGDGSNKLFCTYDTKLVGSVNVIITNQEGTLQDPSGISFMAIGAQ